MAGLAAGDLGFGVHRVEGNWGLEFSRVFGV